ncbi:tubby C-terminal-like domain-containing protein [Talaromyces proteolyticus]|uniref:Tubby C-terminal-like domain-containing protein n=1 Tax=Talaromyces proteolyticus TaxID=1131652 RepID=A0AAD4KNV3_9EURO|nr:tubby C-terminal-like domain-containing protein [Talaromyces proteolyticus]KAH8697147.1 tubby C-terminal-like domain-containing protein [Talaromyces proteolyticus]
MAPALDQIKQPIGLRPEHVAASPTSIRVKMHGGASSLAASDFTVTTDDSTPGSTPTKLFSVDGHAVSWQRRRKFRDASDLPLFELARKKVGVTWFVYLPEDNGEPIATLAPKWSALKDKLNVFIRNAAHQGEQVELEVRGQDIWKLRTNIYMNGSLIMTCKRTDKFAAYIPGKGLEWKVDVAQGVDVSLGSLIVVVLAQVMYHSSYPSSHSAKDEVDSGDGIAEKHVSRPSS